MNRITPHYQFSPAHNCYLNHCSSCGIVIGDRYLHGIHEGDVPVFNFEQYPIPGVEIWAYQQKIAVFECTAMKLQFHHTHIDFPSGDHGEGSTIADDIPF